jgi:ATP-dependent Lhr-like helicase
MEPGRNRLGEIEGLSATARDVAEYLEHNGASFLLDIARDLGRLKTQTEAALWELVARGQVTGDGIAGLRTLLTPEMKRQQRTRHLRGFSGGRNPTRLLPTGRWSLWRGGRIGKEVLDAEKANEKMARQLLYRYGVVFRDLLARETRVPAWRTLLQIYRRLEARGEIRGGRFVNGFVGEQFALPEAVEALRSVRREDLEQEAVIISSSDPLNLVGILTPSPRISPYSNMAIAYRNGVPEEIGPLGAVLSKLPRKQIAPHRG